jgi:hypothetical protein
MSNPEIHQWVVSSCAYVWEWFSSGKFWVGVLIPTFLVIVFGLRKFTSNSVSVGLPFGLGSRTYDTTPADRIVAWKLYVQLSTRKAALPFDEENDVIGEVYDSLYKLFETTRELLIALPPREFQRENGVASLMLRVMNDGVRPHLTQWQFKYRKWWEEAVVATENRSKSPQEIQRQYPYYIALVADLKKTNTELSKFSDELLAIARRSKPRLARPEKIVPIPPNREHPLEDEKKLPTGNPFAKT